VLSFLLRRLYGVPVTDCNSGIRCVRRRSYQGWKVRSRGMEFASALLIRAASEGARIEEIPVDLRPTPGKRVSHLRTWTDGMRHLLVILAASPILFWRGGVLLTLLSLLLAVPCVRGPRLVFHTYGIWGEHTLVIALIIGFYGTLAMNTALSIYSHSAFQKAPKSMLFLLRVREEGVLFWWLVATMAVTCAGCFYVFLKWRHNDYGNINYITTILFFLYACVVHSTLLFGIFQAHLGLRSRS